MPPSGKEVVRRLKKLGWEVIGQRGSHMKLQKNRTTVVIPIHGNHDLGLGLVKAIEKQTGEVIR